jgi:hypothetical protein
MSQTNRTFGTTRFIALGIIGLCLTLVSVKPAQADAGVVAGDAHTIQGSLLGSGIGINTIVLPASGSWVGQSLPLNAGVNLNLVAGELTLSVRADSVQTECEGGPNDATVWADCMSRIEGLEIGLDLATLGGLVHTGANIVSASVLESHSFSWADSGPADSTSSGTTIVGLCVYTNGVTVRASTEARTSRFRR